MSAAFEPIRKALAAFFEAGWKDGGQPRTPVAWPNVSFKPPENRPWVRFTILSAEARRHLITGSRQTGQRITGLVVIQVFTPAGSGDGAAMTLADQAKELFSERRIEVAAGKDPLATAVPEARVIGADREWYQVNVSTPFEYLET